RDAATPPTPGRRRGRDWRGAAAQAAEAVMTVSGSTTWKSAIRTPSPTVEPSRTRAPPPMTARGPTWALAPIRAPAATTAPPGTGVDVGGVSDPGGRVHMCRPLDETAAVRVPGVAQHRAVVGLELLVLPASPHVPPPVRVHSASLFVHLCQRPRDRRDSASMRAWGVILPTSCCARRGGLCGSPTRATCRPAAEAVSEMQGSPRPWP